jgi:transcription antitermination factor NusG
LVKNIFRKHSLYGRGRSFISDHFKIMFSANLATAADSFRGEPPQAGQAEDRWYVLHTYPRHEKSVVLQIEERRIACFLPLYRSMRRWKDRRKELELALFPGYVFVRIDLKDRLRVLQMASVVRFVSFNGMPAPLPDAEMVALMNGLKGGVGAEPHPYLTAGRSVRVSSGPLAGVEGILVRRKDGFRVVLSLDLIMRSVAVEVDECDVEPS